MYEGMCMGMCIRDVYQRCLRGVRMRDLYDGCV